MRLQFQKHGGEGGIRTPDTLSGMAAFEAARFNRSRTSPRQDRSKLWIYSPAAEQAGSSAAYFSSEYGRARSGLRRRSRWLQYQTLPLLRLSYPMAD